ncbi:MAG: hypothetical protein KBT59_01080 [Sphingomonadales bacterium]|nr:hypothetical protein [Sphingomonadales bacterium]
MAFQAVPSFEQGRKFSREDAKPLRVVIIDDTPDYLSGKLVQRNSRVGQSIIIARSAATRQSRASWRNHQRMPPCFTAMKTLPQTPVIFSVTFELQFTVTLRNLTKQICSR